MPGLALNATPLGEAAKMAITFMACACRLVQDRNLVWQLSAITEHTLRLALKVTTRRCRQDGVTFMTGACRLTHSQNLTWQLSAIAEHAHRLALKATPLSKAAKTVHAFMARHVRLHANLLKVYASHSNYLSSLR
jgi:hypothetical protein